VDTVFVGGMGPPGGGRNPVSSRLLRHFNIVSFADMSGESLTRIFSTILGAFLSRGMGEALQQMTGGLVGCCSGSLGSVLGLLPAAFVRLI
jgi:dynein heavy chain